mgnify:CR=1 FL=1
MNKNYAGIIFRDVPEDERNMMEALGFLLGSNDWVLRATGDLGITNPFLSGCMTVNGEKILSNFNNASIASISYANKTFPKFHDFSDGKQKYLCSLISAIMGEDGKSPVKFVCLYGGTNQNATRDIKTICTKNNITCYDIYSKDTLAIIQGKIDIMVKNFKEQ